MNWSNRMKRKLSVLKIISTNLQLLVAVLLTLSGIVLLFSGFWVDPEGTIDASVLVAFGETCTFAGGLFGVDYKYKEKRNRDETYNERFHMGRDAEK